LLTAQRFLQGRGVAQSCDIGLRHLRRATMESDPEAHVQMAALYQTGHCVEEDRVQAYRWYSSAAQLKPDNAWIEQNRDRLWREMSAQERSEIAN
jgi:TPR repeat protein